MTADLLIGAEVQIGEEYLPRFHALLAQAGDVESAPPNDTADVDSETLLPEVLWIFTV